MSRILVTGHRGLLGSACVRRFKQDHEVLIYVDNLFDSAKFRRWMLDAAPDCIVHCAAKVGGVKSNQELPVDFLTANLAIQSTVIDAAADFGVKKLVFIGTSCLYPRFAPAPVKEESLLTGPFEPAVEAYAIAKLAGYALCKAHRQQYGRDFVTACPANLYGPGDNYGVSAHVIPALIKRFADSLENNKPLTVWGDGSAIREFLYVDDCADAIAVILKDFSGELINIGTGHGTSIAGLVETMCEVITPVPVKWDASAPTGIPKKTFDISKLTALGWKPKTNLRDGLLKTWDDFTNNKNHRNK